MKLVLVRPPFYALFGVTTPKMKTYPLNLLYLATYVRDSLRHSVAIVDGECVTVPELVRPDLTGEDPEIMMNRSIPNMIEILNNDDHPIWVEIERQVLSNGPDIVGITCNSGAMDTVRILTKRFKAKGLPVILGGSHPSVLPEQSLNYTGADFVVTGEGETALLEMMDCLDLNHDLGRVKSLAWRQNAVIKINPKAELIKDIDLLPAPDRSLIDRSQYFGEVIMTGRGCPFNCAYCASRNIWGKRARLRSVDSIIRELQTLYRDADNLDLSQKTLTNAPDSRPGRWVVKVVDDTFTVVRKRTMELLDQIISNGLNRFEFTGGVRADTLDEALVARMREANFRRVTLGVESGSPRILEMIRKGETNDDVKRAFGLLKKAGIRTHAFFMIGLPGETLEDIELSKKLILEIRPDHVEINMVTPYPGTDLFDKLIPEPPEEIDRWYRWFHQGMATHSDRLGYDLDAAYKDFLDFAKRYHDEMAEAR